MIEKNKNTLDNLKLRAKQAAALGVTAVVAVAAVEHFKGNELHAGHDKVYTTHVGDTEWGIAERAYPNQDPRAVIGLIQSQESAADQKGHILQPGEKLYFAQDSQLGTEVQAPSESVASR